MTQQEIVQVFQQKITTMLQEFETATGHRAIQTASLPPVMRAVLEAAGAPSDGWKIEVGWQFVPITQPEKTPTPSE